VSRPSAASSSSEPGLRPQPALWKIRQRTNNPNGTISGLITDPQGRAVTGVPVWAIRTFALSPTSDPISAAVLTDSNGGYYFPSLVPGSYRICVTADGQGLLDPCAFSDTPPIWNLQTGQSAEIDVAMQRGAFVHLRFDDPNGNAAAAQKSSAVSPIRVPELRH